MFQIPAGNIIKADKLFDSLDKEKQELLLMEIEAKFKYNFMKKLYERNRKVFAMKLRNYFDSLKLFAQSHKNEINVKRTKFMLLIGRCNLEKIFEREEKTLKEQNKTNFECVKERDYLPFANKMLYFAEKLENAPKKPQFITKIDSHKFVDLFHDYAKELKIELFNTKINHKEKAMMSQISNNSSHVVTSPARATNIPKKSNSKQRKLQTKIVK